MSQLALKIETNAVRCFSCSCYHEFGLPCITEQRCIHFRWEQGKLARCKRKVKLGTDRCDRHPCNS